MKIAAFVTATAFATGAAASPCALGSDKSVLSVVSSEIEQRAGMPAIVRVGYRAGRAVRMIDGAVVLTDALGERLGEIDIPRDQKMDAGVTAYLTDLGTGRINGIAPDDVQTTICVRGIVFGDGEVWRPQ